MQVGTGKGWAGRSVGVDRGGWWMWLLVEGGGGVEGGSRVVAVMTMVPGLTTDTRLGAAIRAHGIFGVHDLEGSPPSLMPV